MKTLTTALTETKTVVAISLSTLLTVLILTPILLLTFLEEDNSKIRIRPEFNIGEFKSECLNSKDALSANISLPEEKEYKTTDDIKFMGTYAFKCSDELKDKVEQKLNYSWKLNDTEITDSKDGNFGKLAAKDYKVEFRVNMDLKGLKQISASSVKYFKVSEPKVNQPNPPSQTPPPAVAPVNNAPSASILRPKDGSNYTATQYDRAKNLYATISFAGAGTDPEDGNLGGASLEWYLINATGGSQFMGVGNSISYNVYAPSCANNYQVKLVAKDSKGLTAQNTINISVTGNCPIIIY